MDSGPRRSNAGDPVRAGTLRGVVVRMRFEGSMGARPSGEGRLDARHNWFRGNDPAKWMTDVHGFRSVRMPDLYRASPPSRARRADTSSTTCCSTRARASPASSSPARDRMRFWSTSTAIS